jgi:hypothetical protein
LEKLNQEDQSSFDAEALLQETLDEINQLEEANKVPLTSQSSHIAIAHSSISYKDFKKSTTRRNQFAQTKT